MRKILLTIGALTIVAALPPRPAAAQTAPEFQGAGARFARATAQEYRELARYPESSRALKEGEVDPVKAKRLATRQSMRGPGGALPALAVWASAVGYQHPEPVDLFAQLEMAAASGLTVQQLAGEISNASGDLVTAFTYRDDGQGADQRAGDGVYSARVALPVGTEPDFAESLQVTATARLTDGDLRQAVGGFVYGKPAAKLTGRYRDDLRDGNVVISAEVEVTESGRFHLAGTVHSLKGEPIGTAQSAVELAPGRHWIDLSFYGLMFHDRQVAGPFRLGSLALATTTRMPNALNDLVENAHVTRAYRLAKLNGKAFGEAKLTEAAGRLEAEARRLEVGAEVQQP